MPCDRRAVGVDDEVWLVTLEECHEIALQATSGQVIALLKVNACHGISLERLAISDVFDRSCVGSALAFDICVSGAHLLPSHLMSVQIL